VFRVSNSCICPNNDVNSPYKFETPWHTFEFANHILDSEASIVIISMAWMTREDGREFSRMPLEPDMDTLNYWISRLEPVIRAEREEEIIVIFANRTGVEAEAVYAGTSAVIGIQGGSVHVYGILGRGDKDLLVVDTDNTPFAKLVHRPEPNSTKANPRWEPSDTLTESIAEDSSFYSKPPATTGSASQSSIQTRRGGPSTSTDSARNRPKLSIPTTESNPRKEKDTVGTPTCPSPTPISLRPKVTIGEVAASTMTQLYLDAQYPSPQSETSPSNAETRILGGRVRVSHDSVTPIDEVGSNGSVSSQLLWVPTDGPFRSPMRSPRDFRNWPGHRDDDSDGSGSVFSFQTDSSVISGYIGDSRRSQREPFRNSLIQVDEEPRILPSPPRLTSAPEHAEILARHEPPEPRNVSRAAQYGEQADLALPFRPKTNGFSHKLESLVTGSNTQRDGNAFDLQGFRDTPDRPASPKSRNTSRNRDTVLSPDPNVDRQDSTSRASILIAASPSVWDQGPQAAHQRVMNGDSARSNSAAGRIQDRPGSRNVATIRNLDSSATSGTGDVRPESRATSRGRQRMTTGIVQEQVHIYNANATAHQPAVNSIAPPETDLSQFRYIEEITYQNCPVHGSRSTSAAGPDVANPGPMLRTPNTNISGGSASQRGLDSSGAASPHTYSREIRPVSSTGIAAETPVTPGGNNPNRFATSPRDPTTPKAMVLVFDDEVKDGDDETTNSPTADAVEDPLKPNQKQLRCFDRDGLDKQLGIERPKSAVW
jgi:hypothetical protein